MTHDSIDNVRLDINNEQVRAAIYARIGDTKTRTVHITLSNRGQVVALDDAVVAEMMISKADGNKTWQGMVVIGNELQYTWRTQDLSAVGENLCQVRVTFSDGSTITSPRFSLFVYKKEIEEESVVSTNEYTAFAQMVASAESAAEKAGENIEESNNILAEIRAMDDEMEIKYEEYDRHFDEVKQDIDVAAAQVEGTASSILIARDEAVSASASARQSELSAIENASTASLGAQSATESASNASSSAQAASDSASVSEASAQAAYISSELSASSERGAKGYMEEAKAIVKGLGDIVTSVNGQHGDVDLLIPRADGTTITQDEDGTLHGAQTYELPIASESTLGGVKVDGETISIDEDGTLHGVAADFSILANEWSESAVYSGASIVLDKGKLFKSIAQTPFSGVETSDTRYWKEIKATEFSKDSDKLDGHDSTYFTNASNILRADGSTTIEEEMKKYIPSEVINTMPIPSGERTYYVAYADNTFPYSYGLLEIRYGCNISEYTATFKTTGNDKSIYYCIYRSGVWSAWQELATMDKVGWKQLTLPTPIVDGKTRTYSIDLSVYKEIAIQTWINEWSGNVDFRVVPLMESERGYVVSYSNGTSYMTYRISYNKSAITISIDAENMALQNYPLLELLLAR